MKLHIPDKIKKALGTLVLSTTREWTAFGKTELFEGGVRIVDLKIPHQESGGSSTELSNDDSEKWLEELLEADEDPSRWNCWIHSHNTMGAFWSKTDTDQMDDFNTGGPDYFFHLVVSTLGAKAAFTAFKPFVFTDEDVDIVYETADIEGMDDLLDKYEKEVKRHENKLEKLEEEIEELKITPYAAFISPLEEALEERNRSRVYKTAGGYWDPVLKEFIPNKKKEENEEEAVKMLREEMDEIEEDGDHVFLINGFMYAWNDYTRDSILVKEHEVSCNCITCLNISEYDKRLTASYRA